ncbi:MAG: hypothetical protein J3R72DRAFT_512657, partial [Linnemannia gamsii]
CVSQPLSLLLRSLPPFRPNVTPAASTLVAESFATTRSTLPLPPPPPPSLTLNPARSVAVVVASTWLNLPPPLLPLSPNPARAVSVVNASTWLSLPLPLLPLSPNPARAVSVVNVSTWLNLPPPLLPLNLPPSKLMNLNPARVVAVVVASIWSNLPSPPVPSRLLAMPTLSPASSSEAISGAFVVPTSGAPHSSVVESDGEFNLGLSKVVEHEILSPCKTGWCFVGPF